MGQGPVLVVDDDQNIREILTALLNQEGLPSVTASDGGEALEVLTQMNGTPPCLILLDVDMPRMTGFEFVEAYQSQSEPHVPIVLFTADPHAGQRVKAIRVDGVIAKPFELADLLEAVTQYTSRA